MRHPLLWLLLLSLSPPNSAAPSAAVSLAPVVRKTFTENLSVYGVIDPDPGRITTVSLPHAGLIDRVWVRNGQRVRSGDRLLEIVTTPEARRQYLQAKSATEFARRNLERLQRLYHEKLATRTQVDTAKKELANAQAALEALRQRSQYRTQMVLSAPTDGIVIRVYVTQGQQSAAGAGALLIADQQRLVARLGVEPEDLPRLAAGTAVVITPVFTTGLSLSSRLREIHAMIDPATRLVEVLVPIPPGQAKNLILGSRVQGDILLLRRTSPGVPRSAVLQDDKGPYVFTVKDGRAHRIAVETGIEQGDWREIRKGLLPGMPVVVRGNYELEDGMVVREGAP